MLAIEWTKQDVPGSTSDIRVARVAEGHWYLRDPNNDVCHGKLTLTKPDGMTCATIMARMDERVAGGADMFDDENRRLWACVSAQDDMCYTHDMAQMIGLVERLRDPRPARGTATEILEQADFLTSAHGFRTLDIGKGAINVDLSQGVSVTYDGNGADWWHNLLGVYTATTFADGSVHPIFWPDAFGDVAAKAAEYLVDVLVPQVRVTRITRNMKKGR